MIVMLRVDNGGRATVVVNSHYPKKLISILRLDCVAGARTCLPRGRLSAIKAAKPRIKPVNTCAPLLAPATLAAIRRAVCLGA